MICDGGMLCYHIMPDNTHMRALSWPSSWFNNFSSPVPCSLRDGRPTGSTEIASRTATVISRITAGEAAEVSISTFIEVT
jgi:hypothetical protein